MVIPKEIEELIAAADAARQASGKGDTEIDKKFKSVLETAEKLQPEDFLKATPSTRELATSLLKSTYDLAKECEADDGDCFESFDDLMLSRIPMSKRQKKKRKRQGYSVTEAPLNSLIVEDFDEHQIWEEIQLQNSYMYDLLVSSISKLVAQQNRPVVQSHLEEEEGSDEDSTEELLSDLKKVDESKFEEEEEEELSDFFENENTEKKLKKKKNSSNPVYSKSVVDDQFFNLAQMTEFIEQMDAEEEGRGKQRRRGGDEDDEEDLEGINMFEGDDDDEENEGAKYKYQDFFDPPPNSSGDNEGNEASQSKGGKKSVTFADGGDDEDEMDDEGEEQSRSGSNQMNSNKLLLDDEDSEESEVDESTLSNFEKKRRKIEKTIEEMEEEALQPKPWQLTGEVTAETRPENSLLEEHLIYDHLIKQAPEITLKTTQKLEDIIKQRIRDKAWDDVIRKIKPVEDMHEYKKRLVLDAEKSKLSLAEIYEKEYVEKTSKAEGVVAEEKEPEEHIKIKKDMQSLFHKLDALSNYTYTPAPPTVEIKVIANIPAIAREEVGQSVLSEANLLAPQEILEPAKGEVKSQAERSKTDMKRERRLKKKKQHLKRLAQEEKARARGLGMTSIKLAENVVKKAIKEGRVEKEPRNKELKSSKAFFAKLQDQVTTHIDKVAKRKQETKSKSLSAKKFKL